MEAVLPMPKQMFRFKVEGFRELYRALKTLKNALHDKVLRKAEVQALQPVGVAARDLAPVSGTAHSLPQGQQGPIAPESEHDLGGVLRSNIIIGSAGSGSSEHGVTTAVGPSLQAFYGLFVEFGYGPGQRRAQPFMRPAWDQNRAGVLETFKKALWSEIRRAAAKGGAK